jgi:hypothetical protein
MKYSVTPKRQHPLHISILQSFQLMLFREEVADWARGVKNRAEHNFNKPCIKSWNRLHSILN